MSTNAEKVRDEVPWHLMLTEVFKFDAYFEEFATWLKEYAEDQSLRVLKESGAPIESLVTYYERLQPLHDAQFEIVLRRKDLLTGLDFLIALVIAPQESAVEVALFADAVLAVEAHYFVQVKEDFASAFDRLDLPPGGRAHSFFTYEAQQRYWVRKWREAERQGAKKAAWVRARNVPGAGEKNPGITVRTLDRWLKKYE
jgi:hypothetical protein